MFDFVGMSKAMEAMQSVDFDRLAAIPDQLDTLIREQRITNVLLAVVIMHSGGIPSHPNHEQVKEAARGIVKLAANALDESDTPHRAVYVEP